MLIDAATFLVAAATLALIRLDEPRPEPSTTTWSTSVAAGVQFIRRTPVLRQLVVTFALGFAIIGLIETIIFAIVAALGRSPAFLGVLVSAQGVGAIIAGLIAPLVMRHLGEGRVAAGGLVVCGIGVAALTAPITAVAPIAMATLGAGITATVIGANTLLQRRTPAELLGRVDAAAKVAVTVPQTVFIGIGAALIAAVDYRVLLAIMASVMLIAGTWLVTRPDQHAVPAPDPAGLLVQCRAFS